MNVDEAIKFLQSQGFEIVKKRKVTYDGSFLGIQMKGERLDSITSNTTPKDDLEQLRLDALNARNEMISKLSPGANQKNNYASKSTEALRDIVQAHKDAYCENLAS